MAFKWLWTRKLHDREVPAFKIRIEYALDLTQVEGLLLTWAIDRPEWCGNGTEEREFPESVTAVELESIIRDQLRWNGITDAWWPDELTRREIDQARDWAGEVLRSLFPHEFARTWKQGRS